MFLSSHTVRFVEGHDFAPVNYRAGFQSEFLRVHEEYLLSGLDVKRNFVADSFPLLIVPLRGFYWRVVTFR